MALWKIGLSSENLVRDLTIETKNFAFEVKVILGLESTYQYSYGAKIGLNGPQDQ